MLNTVQYMHILFRSVWTVILVTSKYLWNNPIYISLQHMPNLIINGIYPIFVKIPKGKIENKLPELY